MADPPGAPAVPLRADQHHGGYPVHPPRPTRQIGAGDTPYTHVHRHGITPPPIPTINFDIKTSLISLVENSAFHGMKDEDPLKHLDKFDQICSLQNINGVSEDGFKLRVFPFSLGGKALTWETTLSVGSVTTWDQCKQAFLAKFFPASRTAKLRNDISSFLQMNGESFSEAYERFKGYQMKCPHHGFSKESLLSTLYRGVLPKYRLLLDTASNGHFLGQDVEEGLFLVENIATSDANYSEEYDHADRGSSAQEEKHKNELKTLNDKLDKLLLVQQNQVHFISDEDLVQKKEKLNYVGNQGGYQQGFVHYRNNPQDQVYPPQQQNHNGQQVVYYKQDLAPTNFVPPGFGPTQGQARTSSGHELEMKTMLQQIIQGQASGAMELSKKMAEIHNKVDCSYHDLNNRLESLTSKVQQLESKGNTSSSSQKGTLPGKPIPNPKEYCGAIFSTTAYTVGNDENERAIEELSRLLYGPSVERLENEKTFQDGKRNDKKEEASESVEREEQHPTLNVDIDELSERDELKFSEMRVINKEKREAPFEKIEYPYVPLPYEPNFPFAGVISANEVSLEDPMKPPFEEIRMKEFRGWFYDEYDPGDQKLQMSKILHGKSLKGF
uniref:Retrotransposon gag domain-containing protein n=1 Tax=Noccaea caerulescens TaxID=107243 RepID=A0A1J3JEZ7_NOCCA